MWTNLTEFIRDWLPSLAIIAGGIWVLFKWLFSERLRAQKEMPAIDGFLTVQTVVLSNDKSFVSIDATWRNASPLPIHVDTKSTHIDVFQITKDIPWGPVEPKDDTPERIYQHFPYRDLGNFILEPNTNSMLQTQFVLRPGSVYLFQWNLIGNQEKHAKGIGSWTKELVLNVDPVA